jgi:hypothetical protein
MELFIRVKTRFGRVYYFPAATTIVILDDERAGFLTQGRTEMWWPLHELEEVSVPGTGDVGLEFRARIRKEAESAVG